MTRPRDHDGPIRTCVGCRERRPQRDLVRCVLGADGVVHVDRHGAGRGAWLCGAGCLPDARRRGGFDRAFRRSIRPSQLEQLETELAGGDAGDGADTRRGQHVVGIVPGTARLKKTTKG